MANISTLYELCQVRDNLSGSYTLTADIDASLTNPANKPAEYKLTTTYSIGDYVTHTHSAVEAVYYSLVNNNVGNDPPEISDSNWEILWYVDSGFYPIGAEDTDGYRFTGTFDGNGHTIDGIYMNIPGENSVTGFFGCLGASSQVSNLGLTNIYILESYGGNTGAMAGSQLSGSTISNCYVTGEVNGGSGGTPDNVGGFVGLSIGTISSSYSTCSVTGQGNYVGGFAGRGTYFENCYAGGSVHGVGLTAGFIGYGDNGNIIDCYSYGAVSSDATAYGFCGINDDVIISSCFWDTTSSGQLTSNGGSETGFATSYMIYSQYESNAVPPPRNSSYPYYKWNLKNYFGTSSVWVHDTIKANRGYPILRWQGADTFSSLSKKVYFYNGAVVSVGHYGGAIKAFVGAGSTPSTTTNFRFQIVTDIHGQTDVFARVCDGILDKTDSRNFIWSTGDITAANYDNATGGEYYLYQRGPEEVRSIVDTKFGTDFAFYHSLGNHEITDLNDAYYYYIYCNKNSITWMKAEFNDIPNKTWISKEDHGWHYYRCVSSYPPNDTGANSWKSQNYTENDGHSGWNTDDNQGVLGWGELYVKDPSYNIPPEVHTFITPGVTTVCFRKTFTIENQSILDSILSAQVHVLFDDGCSVYLNGTRLKYYFMSPLPTYDQTAWYLFREEGEYVYSHYQLTNSQLDLLVVGTNVIAVEVHDFVADSLFADLFFDLSFVYSDSLTLPRKSLSQRHSYDYIDGGASKETMFAFVSNNCLFVNMNMFYDGIDSDLNSTSTYRKVCESAYLWLCNLLRTNTKPVFVFGHTPIDGIGTGAYADSAGGPTGQFWKLLEDHQCVVAYICGHTHVYERKQINVSNSQIWHIMNSPAGGPPRSSDLATTDDYANMGFSFMDVEIDLTSSTVAFTRWVNKGKDATGSWTQDDSWTQNFVACASLSSCSWSSSSSSASSISSSSSQSAGPLPSSAIPSGHHILGAFVLHKYSEEEIADLYAKYHPQFETLTNKEKEDKLVDLVSNGDLTADQALALAVKEGLSFDS